MNLSDYKTQKSKLAKYEPRYVGGQVTLGKTSLRKYVVMSWKLNELFTGSRTKKQSLQKL